MLARRGHRAVARALATARRTQTPGTQRRLLLQTTSKAVVAFPGNDALWKMSSSMCGGRWFSTTTDDSSSSEDADEEDCDDNTKPVEYKPKNERDELFLRALRLYYEKEGHFFVPTDFVIPAAGEEGCGEWPEELWSVPLGLRVRNFSRGISNAYKRAMLKIIGFPYDDWKTYVWEEHLLPALKVFAELEGHTFVRFPFVVPKGDVRYPKNTWGFKLGFSVALLRQQRDTLTEDQIRTLIDMDFLWTENQYKLKMLLLPGLRRFNEIFGHSEVPPKFFIGEDEDERVWDKSLHGTKLGYLYTSWKNGLIDPDSSSGSREELHELGAFDEDRPNRVWNEIVMPALTVFPQVYGHTDLPEDFTVPHGDARWPEQAWGYELGYVVRCTLSKNVFTDQVNQSKSELRSLGYRWNVLFGRLVRQLLPALRCYKEIYGHCDVPATFVTPANDDQWPPESLKYHLGRQLQLIRKNGRTAPDVQDALEELDTLGFKFDVVESEFLEKVLPSLHAFNEKFGHCDVPRGFVVPQDESWPQRAWGLKLGTAANAIRNRKQYRKQIDEFRNELQDLGFSWTIPQSTAAVERDVVQPCLTVFKEIYGTDDVPTDFAVPVNDTRWPVEASGFKLGKWLQANERRRRSAADAGMAGQRDASRHGRRETQTLEPHQEAYWNEVVMASFKAYAQEHGSCENMPDNFAVPSEAPYPQVAWGLNLGLRLRYIKQHDRYAAEVDKYREELEQLGIVVESNEKEEE
ncbi:hypothetical protein Poli38472_003471 [Pythium oligandrum]|uniref:Helicase-associated domain-containing protein n=1 Tax=Pythium oligandrum TaxID=41045 RepID=A0A8K1C6K5_PYTOL|nr:hypothetical protein Poli38472_003471 [Pythium oligandrum]|eukprot:TMW57546.1 hypothetical protein Poli38472_003471 [Pythium oligandrum]